MDVLLEEICTEQMSLAYSHSQSWSDQNLREGGGIWEEEEGLGDEVNGWEDEVRGTEDQE